jgi:hypothetical protein
MANRWTPGGRKWPAGRCRLLNIARRDVILTAMSTMELRRRVKQTVDALSADKLKDADRLLRGLRTEDAVTTELLRIPGFLESFQRGMKDLAAGRVSSVEKLRRKR